VAAWVPDMLFNFYFAKNHKLPENSATTEDKEKKKERFGILQI
jgi:hypothetical protein